MDSIRAVTKDDASPVGIGVQEDSRVKDNTMFPHHRLITNSQALLVTQYPHIPFAMSIPCMLNHAVVQTVLVQTASRQLVRMRIDQARQY